MYFASNPDSEHDEHVIDYHVNGIDLKFNTDAGVFSKLRVDYGSGVLIKTMSDVTFPANNILDVGTGYGPIGLCNENKQLGERTKNTSPSIDEGMNLVFLLLFCLNLSL